MIIPWRIEMLGGLRARQGDQNVERFRRGKEAGLLAYLAYYSKQNHVRKQLVEKFWPGAETAAGDANLRVALTSLRRRLEPPGTPRGTVIAADRTVVRLNPQAFVTDAAEFESAVHASRTNTVNKIAHLQVAVGLYAGELLPGYDEDWIGPERERLSLLSMGALVGLAIAVAENGDITQALDYAHQATAADPLSEEACLTLMRLYAQSGRASSALSHHERLRRSLRRSLDAAPSVQMRQMARKLRSRPEAFVAAAPPSPLHAASAPSASPRSAEPSLAPPVPALPVPMTRFFGREKEIERLLKMLHLGETRLITLTGPGGSGKTRLALECAHWMREDFLFSEKASQPSRKVWYVSLEDVTDSAPMLETILRALGGTAPAAVDPLDQIVKTLAGYLSLLVLDNFEQLVEPAASTLQRLLERAEGLSCLVTSRRELSLPGEQVVAVAPLPIPAAADAHDRLLENPAVRLFVDRSQARAPEFHLTHGNAEAVSNLVRQLEGIPLALELAATWIRVHPPARILAQLQDRFGFLTKNQRGVSARHQTLWNAIAWSYLLLPEDVQVFLRSLSVFRGGWLLEAAMQVTQEPFTADYLALLQEHSWVTATERHGERRFLMLDTLREFAAAQAPLEVEAVQSRHAAYVLRLAEAANPTQAADLDRLVAEQENWRAALSWYETREYEPTEEGSADALKLVGALGNLWLLRGYVREGRQWTTQALARDGEPCDPVRRARALLVQGNLARYQNDFDATQSSYEQSLALYNTASDAIGSAKACNALGNLAWNRGSLEKAREWYELALATGGEYLDGLNQAAMLENLGNYWSQRKEYAEADRHYEKSRSLFHVAGDLRGLGRVAHNQGSAANAAGHLIRALRLLQEGLTIQWERDYKIGVAYALEEIANVLRQQNQDECAARLWGAAEALREQLEAPYPAEDRESHLAAVASVQARLGEVRTAEAWQAGRRISLEEAVQEAQHPVD